MTGRPRHLVRFKPYQRLMHLVLMVCFLGLAATGLPLLFSDSTWAASLARAFGGFEASALLHRFFATGMLLCFAVHVGELLYRLVAKGERSLLWGPSSMVPQPADLVQMYGHVRWFLGLGVRPHFDRYTYWEKFDYWAVFWGMFIIGGSGLLLWFPQAFSTFLPGWIFNVALLIHGEEALLAVGFIFTIHFFNGHIRPEKFPMDMVMFTGQVSEDELRRERPAEYERLVREGRLDTLAVPPEPDWVSTGGRVVGTTAVAIGLLLLVFILRGFFG
ncbi:MAG: cytochrome b/b6 domain-containing protein [Vicinamibacterales bacterium]|nr:cytochrome b/b6 domain-containing protein [Vicinamibacterales bacterium]